MSHLQGCLLLVMCTVLLHSMPAAAARSKWAMTSYIMFLMWLYTQALQQLHQGPCLT
jgi:hypothetical protein